MREVVLLQICDHPTMLVMSLGWDGALGLYVAMRIEPHHGNFVRISTGSDKGLPS